MHKWGARANNADGSFESLIGGAVGLGSVVYGLVCASLFLDAEELLDDARAAASLITLERIEQDQNLDIIGGSAGAILGLLALYRNSRDPEVLEQAAHCGYHLLENRTASATGHRVWKSLDGPLLTGFSHGTAGIAYALLKLLPAILKIIRLD